MYDGNKKLCVIFGVNVQLIRLLILYMGIYIHEIDTSLLKIPLLMRRKINIHYKE